MIIAIALAVAIIPAGQSFTCPVAYVSDGDTLRCTDGTRVRLRAVDAPEMPNHPCRPGRHCAPGDPYASKRALERLTIGQTLRCVADGRSYNRVTAWCSAGSVDLSCAQFRGGYAVREAKYDRQGRLCR